jgi:hypothetical protein
MRSAYSITGADATGPSPAANPAEPLAASSTVAGREPTLDPPAQNNPSSACSPDGDQSWGRGATHSGAITSRHSRKAASLGRDPSR